MKNCIVNPGNPCANCGERTETDGYGEYIHSGTGKYICHPDSLKRGELIGSPDVAAPKTAER